MTRGHLLLGAVALVSMLGGAFLFHLTQSAPVAEKAQQNVELSSIPLTELSGRESIISDWQDQVLVVNFWAPWCAPCRREIPALIQLSQDYASRNVSVLGIAIDGRENVLQFADENQMKYPLFLAGSRINMYNAAFGNSSGSLPFTAILDRKQRIVFQHNGIVTPEQLQEALEKLL